MERIFETDGLWNGKKVFCPVYDEECLYYKEGLCCIANPAKECLDFMETYMVDSMEEWEELE